MSVNFNMFAKISSAVSLFFMPNFVQRSQASATSGKGSQAGEESIASKLARYPGWSLDDIELYEQERGRRTSFGR